MLTPRRLLNRFVLAAREWVEEAGAIQPGTDLADTFGTFGAGSYIDFPVASLFGTRSIHVGEGALVGRGCTLMVGYSPDDSDLPERGLVIGDRCVIGAGSTLTAHGSITLGDDVWFGQNVFVSDASHGYQDVETPIGLQLGHHEPVRIGPGSWVGHGAVILPGSSIGRNVVVGAGTVVHGEVPDHSVVVGVPGKVVRRLEEGRGWVSAKDHDDVRPAYTAAEIDALLTGAGLTGDGLPRDH